VLFHAQGTLRTQRSSGFIEPCGGRVLVDWPGLRTNQLHGKRDLKPTTDMFAVFNSVLSQHWRLDPQQSAKVMFPGQSPNTVPKLMV
jgi:uncharacterized protein (DUF1501 family)